VETAPSAARYIRITSSQTWCGISAALSGLGEDHILSAVSSLVHLYVNHVHACELSLDLLRRFHDKSDRHCGKPVWAR
jgi:hypothetical protein